MYVLLLFEASKIDKYKNAKQEIQDIFEVHKGRFESIIEILKSETCTAKAPIKQWLYATEELYGNTTST